MKLTALITKNLKILARNTISLIVIVFGPLLIITLAGIAFNNSLDHNIKIGVFSESYANASEQFVTELGQDFEVTRFDSEEECISAITLRGFHSCIQIPANLEIGQRETLTFYIDTSRANIASSIQQSIYQSLYDTTQTISEDLTANLVETVLITETNILRDAEKISKGRDRVESSTSASETSQDLLRQSNLDFDLDGEDLDQITSNANLIRNRINDAISLSEDAISEIDASGHSDPEIENAKENIESIKNNLDNTTSNVSQLISTAQSISSKISTLESNLEAARENREAASKQLGAIQSDLSETQKDLNEISESFQEILASIRTNPLREAEAIIRPVEIEEKPIVTGSRIQLLFPSLVMLIIMLVTMMMGSSQVIFEKTNRAAKRMAMAPVRFITLATGVFTTTFFITIIQVAIILLVTYWIFGVNVNLVTGAILLLATIFFILLGMILGYIFKTENGALLGTLSLASIFFVVSDLILPLESMHPTVMRVVEFFPFVLATDVLKASMFFDAGFGSVAIKLYVLLGATFFLAACLIVAGLFKKKPKKKPKK